MMMPANKSTAPQPEKPAKKHQAYKYAKEGLRKSHAAKKAAWKAKKQQLDGQAPPQPKTDFTIEVDCTLPPAPATPKKLQLAVQPSSGCSTPRSASSETHFDTQAVESTFERTVPQPDQDHLKVPSSLLPPSASGAGQDDIEASSASGLPPSASEAVTIDDSATVPPKSADFTSKDQTMKSTAKDRSTLTSSSSECLNTEKLQRLEWLRNRQLNIIAMAEQLLQQHEQLNHEADSSMSSERVSDLADTVEDAIERTEQLPVQERLDTNRDISLAPPASEPVISNDIATIPQTSSVFISEVEDEKAAAAETLIMERISYVRMAFRPLGCMQWCSPALTRPAVDLAVGAIVEIMAAAAALGSVLGC